MKKIKNGFGYKRFINAAKNYRDGTRSYANPTMTATAAGFEIRSEFSLDNDMPNLGQLCIRNGHKTHTSRTDYDSATQQIIEYYSELLK